MRYHLKFVQPLLTGLQCRVRAEILQNPPDYIRKSLKLHAFMSYPVRKCLKKARSQHEFKDLYVTGAKKSTGIIS